MEFALLGGPDDGRAIELDHRRFAYAGKFGMARTGKAVGRVDGEVVAAAAFDRDRTDADLVRVRYVTVRADRRGEGIGARLLAFAAGAVADDARAVRIAVNNPFAYEAAYKAGFGYTGERTGMAELELEWPDERPGAAYRRGLEAFRGRESLSAAERAFVEERAEAGPPERVGVVTGG